MIGTDSESLMWAVQLAQWNHLVGQLVCFTYKNLR